MKKKIIMTLSLATLLCLAGTMSLVSCNGGSETSENLRHSVTLETSTDVTISGLNEDGYNAGDIVTFTVAPNDPEKSISEVSANGTLLTKTYDGSYSFRIGNEDVVISVKLADDVPETGVGTLSVKAGIQNGTVTLSKTGKALVGSVVSIFAIPNEGFEVDKYYLNDDEISGSTFTVVEGKNEVNVTFKALDPDVIYGSVRVIEEEVINGTIVATLEDGTELTNDNRRQPVGTKVNLTLTPVDECHEVKKVYLNDNEITPDESGHFSFLVVEGKNFITAEFGLINPGQGLVKFEVGSVTNATVTFDKEVNKYYAVDEVITVTVTPNTNYTVKEISLNGTPVAETETANVYSFKVVEGLNTLVISVVSEAEGVEILADETWIPAESEDAWFDYYVEVGKEYQLQTKLTPEGSYDELVWSVSEFDAEFIEVTPEGFLKVKEVNYGSNMYVEVALKSNPDVTDSIRIRSVSTAEFNLMQIKELLVEAQAKEASGANKTELIIEEKAEGETTSDKTTYNFETYADKHSVTEVKNSDGTTDLYYRTIKDNVFYGLERIGGETSVSTYNGGPTEVTSENEAEMNTMLNTMGAIEFGYNGVKNGVIDYFYDYTLGDYTIYDHESEEFDPFENTTIVTDITGTVFDIYTEVKYEDTFWNEIVAFTINLHLDFNFSGELTTATYERKDYTLTSLDESLDGKDYELQKYVVNLTYEEKGVDQNNYFDINDYFYKDFTPEVYNSNTFVEENKLKKNASNKYEINAETTYYINLENVVPTEAMMDVDEITIASSNEDIVSRTGSANGYLYFETLQAEGEVTLTLKSKKITKTLDFVVSFADVEKVEFTTSVADSLMVGGETILEAEVTPDTGIATTDIKYEIISDGTGGAKIEERPDRWGISTDYYLIAGPNAGEINVRATSLADETVFVEKTIVVNAAPSVLGDLIGKTFKATNSVFNMSTYGTDVYNYTITFESNNKARVEYEISVESYMGDQTVTKGTYTADVAQEGERIELSNITSVGTSDIETSEVPSTIQVVYTDTFEFEGLSIYLGDEDVTFEEYVPIDLTSVKEKLIGSTQTFSWSDSYGGTYNLTMVFSGTVDAIKVDIDCEYSSYYSTSTGKFNADVTVTEEAITLSNKTLTEGNIMTYDYPPNDYLYEVDTDGNVRVYHEDEAGGGWDY